jgi:5-methylcytosine-specific restriction endonuclease McrA
MEVTQVLTKTCTKCGEEKPLGAYGAQKRGKHGKRAVCKPCAVKEAQARYTPRPRKTNPIIDGRRACTKCHEVKPVEAFPPNPKAKTGIVAACKACAAQTTADWRGVPGNAERGKQACHDYYVNHKDEIAAWTRQYRAENPQLVSEWGRRKEVRRKASPLMQAYHRQKTRDWEQGHPENVRQRAVRRYGRKKGIPQIDVVDIEVLYERDGAICALCLGFCPREEASQDHIIPITKPGSTESYGNSALAHIDCNRRKNNNINLREVFLYYRGDPETRRLYLPDVPVCL